MTAPTISRGHSSAPDGEPGPAEVLAALAEFSTPETLAMIDREVDDAYRAGLAAGDTEPLRRVLDHWWLAVRLNRGEPHPEPAGLSGPEHLAAALARRGVTG